jgi:predicted MFS family arabinose efflux permease
MVPALLLGVMTDLQIITVGEIMAFAFFLGTVNAFDVPTRQAFLSEMVQKGRLTNAIALNSAAFNGARIIGPVAAGLAIAAVGEAACFYINAVSFLAAIGALLLVRGRDEGGGRPPVRAVTPGGIVRDLAEGLRFVRDDKDIFRIMLLVATISTFGIPYVTFLPVFAQDILGVGPRGLGFLAGASGAGSLLAALGIAFVGEVRKKGRFLSVTGLIFALSLFIFSLSRDYALSAVAMGLSGWGVVSFLAVANGFIQLSTPDALRGRVMSLYALVFLGMAPVGSYVMGFLAHVVGTPGAVSTGAAFCAATILVLSKYLRVMAR